MTATDRAALLAIVRTTLLADELSAAVAVLSRSWPSEAWLCEQWPKGRPTGPSTVRQKVYQVVK